MKRKVVLVALAVVLAASFSGFAKSAKRQAKQVKIDFRTEKNGNLELLNETTSDLVIFAGRIEKSIVLGGIKAWETRLFDLSKVSDMPEQGAFIFRAVPYETYKNGKAGNNDAVYTRLVVYNLNDAEKTKIVIPNSIDVSGKFGFYADNDSSFVVELHEDMPDGEIIATLPPLCKNQHVYVIPSEDGYGLDVFPVYVYVNPKTGKRETVLSFPVAMPVAEIKSSPILFIKRPKKRVDLDSLSKQEELSASDLLSMKLELMGFSAELNPMHLFGE